MSPRPRQSTAEPARPARSAWRRLRHFGLRLAPAAALLLVGCGCPDFDDMVVGDPDGVANAWDRGVVSQGIHNFEAWSGLDGVCVSGVDVRAEINGGLAMGRYYGPRNAIEVIAGAESSTTVHELCHAWDNREGYVSVEMPEKLPVDRITAALYPTRQAQLRESFARLCERGPHGLELTRTIEDRCGLQMEHPAQTFVLDEVFAAAPRPGSPASVGSLRLLPRSLDAFVGDRALFQLASGAETVTLLLRDPPPDPSEEGLTDVIDTLSYHLVTVDPATGLARGQRRFQADAATPSSAMRLVDSTEAPLFLWRQSGGRTLAFRVIEATGVLVELPTWWADIGVQPPTGEGGGVLVGRVALVPLGADAAEAQGKAWIAVDIFTGREVEHPALEGVELSGPADDLYVGALPDGGILRRFGRWEVNHAPAPEGAVGGVTGAQASLALWREDTGWTHPELDAYDVARPMASDGQGHLLSIFEHRDLVGDYDLVRTLLVGGEADTAGGPRPTWLPEAACSYSERVPRVLRSFQLQDGAGGWDWWALVYEANNSAGSVTLSKVLLD